MRTLKLNEETKNNILESLLKRSPNNYGEFEGRVNDIVTKVREERDAAVFAYTKQFDGADISADNVLVTDAEIEDVCMMKNFISIINSKFFIDSFKAIYSNS